MRAMAPGFPNAGDARETIAVTVVFGEVAGIAALRISPRHGALIAVRPAARIRHRRRRRKLKVSPPLVQKTPVDFRGESKVVRPAFVAGGVVPPAGVVEREIVFAVERASRGDGGAQRVARELRRNEVRGERGGRVPRTRCRLPGIVESELEAPPRNSKLLPKRRALRSSPCVHTRWRAPRSRRASR
jgi:hypothetical protein